MERKPCPARSRMLWRGNHAQLEVECWGEENHAQLEIECCGEGNHAQLEVECCGEGTMLS